MTEAAITSPASAAPVRTPLQLFASRLRRNRPALVGGLILAVLYFSAIFSSFLAPYDPVSTSPESDHPPHRVHFFDDEGKFRGPFIYRYQMTDLLRRTYAVDRSQIYLLRFFVKGEPYKLWWTIPCERHFFGVFGPQNPDGTKVRIYLFGADRIGRDIFSRILFGGQISLSIGIIGIAISMSLGMLIGGASGFFGGWVDEVTMRFVELLMSVPGLYLILALRAALAGDNPFIRRVFNLGPGEHLNSGQVYILIIGILGFIGWGGTARVIRGIVLSVRELDYVQAARALGASRLRQIVLHVLPNTFTYVIVSATLSVPGYILGEVALSFLGVGIEDPTPSWGLMLQDAQTLRTLSNREWWVLMPGVFIFITVFAYNFLGDGLRDALDPKADR